MDACLFSAERAFAQIDTTALHRNFCLLRQTVRRHRPDTRVIAVVKCNAYGHGLLRTAAILSAAGCDFFAVATAEEALTLRTAQRRAEILVLGYTPPSQAPLLAAARITQAVFSAPYAAALSAALEGDLPLQIHLKLDGGLCREGFDYADTEGIFFALRQKNLAPHGLFTHFPVADTDPAATAASLSRFLALHRALAQSGHRLFAHAAASAAALTLPESVLDGVRLGISLYGISPVQTALPLTPTLSLRAPVQQLRTVPAGTPVGYGGDFVTKRESRIGTLPLGYGDGLDRRTNGFSVTLHHGAARFRAAVCGRVSMDMTTVDLTDTPAAVGDTVCLWDNAATPAAYLGRIPYEILTALSARLTRIYV
ncbi:MAG: alanine racemase [Ruminococcaceae bacterium]|nr:alanine racemase [Oscillospiraceae bacterium]